MKKQLMKKQPKKLFQKKYKNKQKVVPNQLKKHNKKHNKNKIIEYQEQNSVKEYVQNIMLVRKMNFVIDIINVNQEYYVLKVKKEIV